MTAPTPDAIREDVLILLAWAFCVVMLIAAAVAVVRTRGR